MEQIASATDRPLGLLGVARALLLDLHLAVGIFAAAAIVVAALALFVSIRLVPLRFGARRR